MMIRLSLASAAVALAVAASGCKPAETAELQRIEMVVLQDVERGASLPQIESDVATIVAGQPGADVVALVNDALQLLVDSGVIPANYAPRARAMLGQIAAERAAKK